VSARLVVTLLGAECTGKSTLGPALAASLGGEYVAEYLREWCEAAGRTPHQQEQAAIAAEQARRIEAAAGPLVIADTTPLITALCSQHYFGDDSLLRPAVDFQRRCHLNLLCAPDLPWEADGFLRDGPNVRERFDARLRQALNEHALPWQEIQGSAFEERLRRALRAVTTLQRPSSR
jgi:nicotinamide riboside kinase